MGGGQHGSTQQNPQSPDTLQPQAMTAAAVALVFQL
jgi:hypothetical protein